ncbi:MAG TPA: response regulator [Thermoanaerobaculia bacterium]|nr:response regulator [Thermoanaerobaculia bacterium]
MRVLVIDDEEDVRFVVQMSLGRLGNMTVVEATNGHEGLALAKSGWPELILLDMMMPGMDGAEVFRQLRANSGTAGIPVVFLTAKAMVAEVQRLKDLGAKGVILKPFDPLTLAADITAILAA